MLSPKARKKTKKALTKALRAKKDGTTAASKKYEIESKIEKIDHYNAHPRRPRVAYFGELLQMDTSPHLWFGDIVTHLHLAIDDATGMIVGGLFDTQETLNAYYNITRQILINYGILAKILNDKRTVFEYKRKNAPQDHQDTFTKVFLC